MNRLKLGLLSVLLALGAGLSIVAFTCSHDKDGLQIVNEHFKSSKNGYIKDLGTILTNSNDPRKTKQVMDFELNEAKAEWYAAQNDYTHMHESSEAAIEDCASAFGQKSSTLKEILISHGSNECKFEKWPIAIDLYTRAIDIDPNDYLSFYWRGYANYKNQNFQKAVDDLTVSIDNCPLGVEYHYRAHSYIGLHQDIKGINDFTQAIKIDPTDHTNYRCRAAEFNLLKEYQKALDDSNKAISLDPKEDDSYSECAFAYNMLGQFQSAINICTKGISSNNSNSLYNERAYAYNELEQYDKAIDDCNKEIEVEPENERAYFERGFAHHQLRQYKQAIEDYKTAIRIYPKYAAAHRNLGISYMEIGQQEKCIEELSKAIALRPYSGHYYFDRAKVYRKLDKIALADKDLEISRNLNYDPNRKRISSH